MLKDVVIESDKTKKARAKLKKKLEQIESKVTKDALERKTVEIHRWIARHASFRAVLKTKEIALFDENKNTALLSPKISRIMDILEENTQSD